MNKKFTLAAFIFLFVFSAGAEAALNTGDIKTFGRPGPETEPTKVEVIMAFLDIDNINTF